MRDLTRDSWLPELIDLAAEGYSFLDLLTVVDRGADLEVVARLVEPDSKASLLVSTRVPADEPTVDSLVSVFPGASWHEREAAETFGVTFRGHPDPRPLLTDGDQPPLLRKSTPLTARVEAPWPGVDAAARRRARVPGVSDEWTAPS